MTNPQPTCSTRSGWTTPRLDGVSKLQWAVLVVAYAILALTVPIILGVGHAFVPAFAALCALELLLCVGVLFVRAATADRGVRD